MGREQFVGTWNLVSDERHTEDGEVFYPFGQDAVGQLMYDNKGYLSAHVMSKSRPRFAFDDIHSFTPDEAKGVFKSYLAYFGTYSVDESKNTVIHHVVGCTFPDMIGTNNVRFFQFSGKRLVLRISPGTEQGRQVVGYITWERVE